MKFPIIIVLIIISFGACLSQGIHINPGVDTTDIEVQKAIQFYQEYLNEFKGGKIPNDFCKYWSQKDCETYEIPDPILYGLNEDYPTYSLARSKTIIYVKPENKIVEIRSVYGWTDSTEISLFCIINHFIQTDDFGNLRFINPLEINTKNWQSKNLRNVTFYYPSYHIFNRNKADSLISSIKSLEQEWGLEPIDISYYLADSREEVEQIKGFDFSLLTGNREKPSGISDDRNNIIYCAGLGENYFHEVVHIYLNRLFADSPIKEGAAVHYGGSMGHDLQWHLKRLTKYLNNHPEIDLNNLEEFWYMDNYTNPNSTIQGLICSLIYLKEGIRGLKRISEYDSLKEVIVREFDIEKNGLDEFIRDTLNEK